MLDFANPKCPFCGQEFERVADAIQHLDAHHDQPGTQERQDTQDEQEHIDRLQIHESDDPTASSVEEAG